MTRLDPASRGFLCAGLACLLVALPAFAAPTFQDQVMEQVNVERWNNGQLAPLKRNAKLESAANTHAQNMALRDFTAHCDLDTKTSPWDRIRAAGYSYNSAAENIAAGYTTPATVMAGWMNSSGHRANILSTVIRELGVGWYYESADQATVRFDSNGDCTADGFGNGPYYHYWCQDFGKITTVYPVVINREAYETANPTVDLYIYGQGWAQQMRFRNETYDWSAWQAYATNVTWTLSAGNGLKTVTCEIKNGSTVYSNSDDIVLNVAPSAVGDEPAPARNLALRPAVPNPFARMTRLAWHQPGPGHVILTIHDVAGRRVVTLIDAEQAAGEHEVPWDGRDAMGVHLAAGVYFGRIESAGRVETQKILLTR